MKVLIAAKEVPLGSIVTKKNGEKEYYIRDDIKIYGDNSAKREITADTDTRFLVSKNGDVNIIAANTELVWHVHATDLHRYLDERDEIHHL